MKKYISVLSALILAASLAGCANETSSDSGSSSDISSSVPESTQNSSAADSSGDFESTGNSDNSGSSENAIKTPFGEITAPDGKPFDLTNTVVGLGDAATVPIAEMDEEKWDKWVYVMDKDCVYLAEPLGTAYNSVDNADIFDSESETFEGAPKAVKHEYKKYKIGDKFGDLTVDYTESSVNVMDPTTFDGCMVGFKGEVTATGFCMISDLSEGYVAEHDILFFPDADCKSLPIMNYGADGDELFTFKVGDVCVVNEFFGYITLGNTDEMSGVDLSAIPEEGKLVKVSVTIKDPFFKHVNSFSYSMAAELVSVEAIA